MINVKQIRRFYFNVIYGIQVSQPGIRYRSDRKKTRVVIKTDMGYGFVYVQDMISIIRLW